MSLLIKSRDDVIQIWIPPWYRTLVVISVPVFLISLLGLLFSPPEYERTTLILAHISLLTVIGFFISVIFTIGAIILVYSYEFFVWTRR